ncbi:MAG: antitoxin [Promethearchaeota archaeon]|nr:MAG: antitoxin [Candidatus Lokiarchaeota archaeon]
MTSRSISITKDVYEKLNKFRMRNESYSQAIKRLLESKLNIMELAGAWNKIPDLKPALDLVEKVVKKIHQTEDNNIKTI